LFRADFRRDEKHLCTDTKQNAPLFSDTLSLTMGQCPSTFSGKRNPSMKIKEQTIPFHAASVGEDEARAAADVIRSGWLTMGPKTIEFERNFASYVGARHAIGVSSCTAALHLALEAVGLQQGDEVLVPTTTFTATAEVVVYFKAIPVLVDVDPITLCIDPEEARRKITSRTRAILPVHFAGQPCDMDRIQHLAAAQ